MRELVTVVDFDIDDDTCLIWYWDDIDFSETGTTYSLNGVDCATMITHDFESLSVPKNWEMSWINTGYCLRELGTS